MTTKLLPTYTRPPRAAIHGLPGYKQVPGFVRRRLDESAEAHPPGDAPLGVAHAVTVDRTPEGDERLTGEGGAELGQREVYPGYRRPADIPRPATAASGVTGDPARQNPVASYGYPDDARQTYRDMLADENVEDTNGRGRSGLRMALRGAGNAASSGSLAYTAGAALGGLATGLIDKNSDEEEIDRPRDLARAKAAADAEAAAEKAQRERETHAADVNVKNSTADWNRQRGPLAQAKDEQGRLKYEISNRLKDPRPFDLNNVYDSDLLVRASAAGMRLNADGFGDHKNPFSLEVIDPDDPTGTRKTRLVYDRAGGDFRPLEMGGQPVQTGYVTPVKPSGMTESQERTDADRDRAFDATQEYRQQQLGLSSARLQEAMLNGLSARAAREFSTATQRLFARRTQIESQISDLQKRAASLTVDPADARQRIADLERERDGITSQIDAERGKALGAMSGAPSNLPGYTRPAPPSAAAPSGSTQLPPPRAAGGWGEDPDVRAYADVHFGGDYGAAQKAIDEQQKRRRR